MTDYPIGSGVRLVDGSANYDMVRPGDRLLVGAGRRDTLRFSNLRGSAAAPIVIVNAGGRVVINSGGSVCINFENCQYIRFTGAGVEGVAYGFDISNFTNSGVRVTRLSQHIELDHLEIHHSDPTIGAGFRIGSFLDEVPQGWVQDRTHIHHCYVHHMAKEAFYAGHGSDQNNPGAPLHNLEIDHCLVEECGWDGIQVRNARQGCHIHDNTVRNVGARSVDTTQGGSGLIIGRESAGDWCDNVVINADRGIQLLHHDPGVRIYRNLFVHCGYWRDGGAIIAFTGNALFVYHNTIVDSNNYGVRTSSSANSGELCDNIVAASGTVHISCDLAKRHNVVCNTVAEVRFVDPAAGNYHLLPGSPAAGAASDGSDAGAYPLGVVDNVITADERDVDGAVNYRHIRPGDRLIVPAGERGLLRLLNLRGEPDAPITIVNEGGPVRFRPQDPQNWVCIVLENCQYIHLTGTGDPDTVYGFDLSNFTNCGLFARMGSEYMDVDHLEIHHPAGAAGAGVKAFSLGSQVPDPAWVQHDTVIQDCHVHDVNREAFYIGQESNPDPERSGMPLSFVELARCRIERCGLSGIRVANVREGCHIHHNYAEDVGLQAAAGSAQEGAGLHVGLQTGGLWHDNHIVRAFKGMCMSDHLAGVEVFRNLFEQCGAGGQAGGIHWATANEAVIHHNTIVDSSEYGVSTAAHAGSIRDNIVAESGRVHIEGAVPTDSNVVRDELEDVRFVAPETGNYNLRHDSPARGAASDGSDAGAFPYQGGSLDALEAVSARIEQLAVELAQAAQDLKVAISSLETVV